MTPLQHYIVLAVALFAIGAWGVLARRSIIAVIMSIELMLNAVNITLVAFSNYLPYGAGRGEVLVLLVFAIAAAEVAIGLAIAIAVYRLRRDVQVDDLDRMRG